jgi:PAS domain S-box-containing protein
MHSTGIQPPDTHDATSQKRSLATMLESETELQRVLDLAPIYIARCDRDRRYRFVNRAYAARFGRQPEEFIGQPIAAMLGRDAYEAFAHHVDTVLAGQRVEFEADLNYEGYGRRFVHCTYTPERSDDGQVDGWIAVITDITDRKRAEETQALLAAIVASSDDAIVSKTLDGVITSWNAGAERLFGYTSAEAVGRSITLIIPTERLSEEDMILSQLRRGERVEHFETVRQAKDGRLIDISVTISPIRNSEGKVIGASKVARDITAQKAAERALLEADRRKDEFLAMLAHELRNPLAPIRNAVQIIRAQSLAVPKLQWARDVIDRQVQQMTRLVDDLLDVSRISQGKFTLRRERVELTAVVSVAVEASRPLIEKWGHELTVTIPPEPMLLDADPARLSQVLLNLLNNAAKYTKQGGHIGLTAECDGGAVVLRVTDTGIGIPAEMLPRVFEMFTQVDDSLDRAQGGLGIGLTLVQRLVELHGGTVAAHSAGPGQGSEFVVRLPLPSPEPEAPATAGPVPPAGASGPVPQRRILVVDDNKDAADSLGMLLRVMGNDVHIAYDGLEAVGAATTWHPQVVLMDIGLPKLNGYEAARRIREQNGSQDMVLIALTGWGQEEDRRRSREAGFDQHLTKPVDFNALQELLGTMK